MKLDSYFQADDDYVKKFTQCSFPVVLKHDFHHVFKFCFDSIKFVNSFRKLGGNGMEFKISK
jgi:hypothetical protein